MKSTNNNFSHFELENGDKVNTAYIDGYCFGDRLLEGANFKLHILSDGHMEISVDDSSAGYFASLNSQYWLAKGLEFAQDNDIFYVNNYEEAILVFK